VDAQLGRCGNHSLENKKAMKKYLSLLMLLGLAACGPAKVEDQSNAQADSTNVVDSVAAATPAPASKVDGVPGYYVGEFVASKFTKGKSPSYSNLINISIDELADGKVIGHSVVAGNSRPFSGSYTMEGERYKVEAAEPGDDKYDGKFSFEFNPIARVVKGTWVANDAKLAVTERTYDLQFRQFIYDPTQTLPEEIAWEDLYGNVPEPEWQRSERTTDDATKFNASDVKLTKEDVENMYKGDLEILRNSIYARHGYSFKNRKIRYVFDKHVPWYIPVSTDVSKELTKLEEENIALLKRYEEHAAAYYDEFGR
jgi:hypothetical protein